MHLNNAFPHPISDPKYILSDILFYPEVKINTAENQKFGTFLLNIGTHSTRIRQTINLQGLILA